MRHRLMVFRLPVCASDLPSCNYPIDPAIFAPYPINIDVYTAREDFADKFEQRHENTEEACDHKVADTGSNVQPAAFILHHPEKVQCHHITDRHNHHE